ncbi:hypothetical protein BDW75DRAFT_236724 [Aspergillus navahoensis]
MKTNRRLQLSSMLTLLALQMAMMHDRILQTILDIAAIGQDVSISKADHGPLWQRLYLRGVLKVRLMKQHYLIVDALDGCKAGAELFSILTNAQEQRPLSVLVTREIQEQVWGIQQEILADMVDSRFRKEMGEAFLT